MTHVCDANDRYVVVVRPVPSRDSYRSGDAVVVVDEKRRIRHWNAAAEALTGISASAALGRNCWDVVGGRTDGGTVVCGPACGVVSRGDVARFCLVINTARCKRRVFMSTIVCETGGGNRVIHVLSPEDAPDVVDLASLTNREREVLALLSEGLDVRAAALHLGISVTTMRTHVRHILSALGVRSQAAAVAKARRISGSAS
jgi:DNA-binding CsgD family transcriptional regulator